MVVVVNGHGPDAGDPTGKPMLHSLQRWDPRTGESLWTADGVRRYQVATGPGSDGPVVAIADKGEIRIHDLDNGTVRHRLRFDPGAGLPVGTTALAVGTDASGPMVAAGITSYYPPELAGVPARHQVWLWRIGAGHPSLLVPDHPIEPRGLAFLTLPDGATVLASAGDTVVSLWDPATGDLLARRELCRGSLRTFDSVTLPSGQIVLAAASNLGELTLAASTFHAE